jgi:hypothetical protein
VAAAERCKNTSELTIPRAQAAMSTIVPAVGGMFSNLARVYSYNVKLRSPIVKVWAIKFNAIHFF